ncbi:zf-HC2 domain-containing protein [Paraburkholderia acidisoli]|uniref:Anti-sigma factor n=1 Tax=Paraburkholderia acidisoli TaxID=2571748 RepID=A0A7Z2GHP4_9BURK|nr:zf-HC2 domain-containing protein [Paraburkholderia acidisoli]QGZ61615.1 anti-sigma factor [Paraburkholderia acidisoli]
MNCDEARPLVDASVDRELSAADEWRVRAHLAGCAHCQAAADDAQAISRVMRTAPYHRAPANLAMRIAAALPPVEAESNAGAASVSGAARAPRRPRRPWLEWLRGSAGLGGAGGFATPGGPRGATLVRFGGMALALCALAVAVTLHATRPPANAALIDDLVSSHVRAEISGRDVDVISSDRHTVKPWFNGRIDYAPPVVDLAQQGFPLAGGRLDYVGRERVAVLIYRYRKHVIDVYVFPPGANGQAERGGAAPAASDGYALLRWQAAGMTWWAVSDAGADALDALRAALDARLAAGATEAASS